MTNKLAAIYIPQQFQSPFGPGGQQLGRLVRLLLQSSIVLAGVVVLFLLIFGGIKTISSAGNSDPQSAAQGKQAITWAIIGFIIIVFAYLIIRALELMLGYPFITSPFITGVGIP